MTNEVGLYWWCSRAGHLLDEPAEFCPTHVGVSSLLNCPNCGIPIGPGLANGERPEGCPSCGKAYPWYKTSGMMPWTVMP